MVIENLKCDFTSQPNDPDTLNIRLYGDVELYSYDPMTGEIRRSKNSQDYFAEQLDKYRNVKQINLYINSAGGFVDQGYGIYANLKRHPAHKTCYIDGFANSIASIIALSGDEIIMYPNSMMGIHNMMTACFGNAAELRKTADDLEKIMEGCKTIYLERAAGKITAEKLTELLDNETMLTADECMAYGFCDRIIGRQSPDQAAGAADENQHPEKPNGAEDNSQTPDQTVGAGSNAKPNQQATDRKSPDIFACIAKSLL